MNLNELVHMYFFVRDQEDQLKMKKKELREKINEILAGEDKAGEGFIIMHKERLSGIDWDLVPEEMKEPLEKCKKYTKTFYIYRKEDNEN